MGKNKQAQRTKNNARPSNSSRSAELLGTAIPNFVGFSAVKDGGYVPVLPGLSLFNVNEIEMNNVDANFQIVLKKMNKKDATTKCKALQEFAVMCKDSELSAVEGMLPFWPRLYCALSIDVEHRVREGAQLAHAAVVKRVGKGIALYLKQLAGAWFTSQHDTYPPAASAASNSFNDTFQQRKAIDAIIHCQREILTYICDNIVVHTAQSLSPQKSLTVEEMEAKYQKVLIANLQGYSFYLKKVPIVEIEKMIDIHSKIVSSNRFWKLVKHDALPVKTAFFNVLSSMIEYGDLLLKDEKRRAITAIMNSLDETEPGLLAAVWEAMLVAVNKIEDWYSVVNIEKLVLPKLWRVLRSGGQCCATIIYPNMLPFISQFPKLNVNSVNLYTNFFSNMRQGFLVKSVQISRSEMFAVTTSFMECLRYSILLNVNNETLCDVLLKEQLIPLLQIFLKEYSPTKQILFCEVTYLVRYWSKNRNNPEYKSYSHLIKEFWDQVHELFDTAMKSSECVPFDSQNPSNAEIEFLLTLKNAPVHKRKNLKVQFSDPDYVATPPSEVTNISIDSDPVFLSELYSCINLLCTMYINKITEERTIKYVVYLNTLVTSFDDEEFCATFAKSLKTEINFSHFYNEVLRNWLLEKTHEIEYVVDLIFSLTKYLDDAEKEKVLESLTEFDDIVITRNVVQCALSKNNRNDPSVKKWCSPTKLTNLLIDTAKELASGSYKDLDKNQKLLLLAIETFDNGDLLIKEEGVNEIVLILCNSFDQVDETCMLHFAKLISSVVPLTWTHNQSTFKAGQVLEMLLDLCIQEHISNNSILIDTVRNVWKEGLLEARTNLSQSEFIDLTKKFAIIMWEKIYNSHEDHIKETLIDVAADFLEIAIKNDVNSVNDDDKEVVLTFLTESKIKTWMAEVTGIVMYAEAITGKLYISTLDQTIQIYHNSESIKLTSNEVLDSTENCLKWALFNTSLLNKLYLRSTNSDSNDEEDSNSDKAVISNSPIPGMTDILTNIMYSSILGQIYINHYKSTKHCSSVSMFLSIVRNDFKELQTHFNEDVYNEIRNRIKVNSSGYGSMLPYLVRFYCKELHSDETPEKLLQDCKDNDASVTNNDRYLQEIQILCKLENLSISTCDDISALIIARTMLVGKDDDSNYLDVLTKVISYEKKNPALLLLDCDISQISWDKMVLPLELIRLLTKLVQQAPTKLTNEHWNFTLISLVLWQLSIAKSKHNVDDFKVTALTVAVCQLYHELQSLMYKHEQESITELPRDLLDEWKNVFAGDIQCGIIQMWTFNADFYNEKTTVLKPIIPLDYLGKAIRLLDGNRLFKEQPNVPSTVPINLDDTIKLSLKLLQSSVGSIQLGAYHVLKHVVLEIVRRDKVLIESENFDPNALSIKTMEDVLLSTQNIVNTILMDFKSCDTVSCTIQLYTDSYTYTVGYLLLWAIILDMCANVHGDLRYQYAEILKNNFFSCLLNNIFRLMPVEALQDNKNKGTKLMEIFSTAPSLDFGESWTESRLDHIVCWLYTNSLRHLPVLVRQWWSTAESRVSAAVDKITTHYVSPMLCQEELLNSKFTSIENVQINIHLTTREVLALYQMDDSKIELSIVLPPNHPLGPITVEPGQHASGSANWRNCHMQLSLFLTHQNGSVWDGLVLWKRNLDKKFAGVEECYICFNILHISTYQLPKLSCNTCRKRFHTPCLYKWFSTSRKSTCPICRNIF